ncbi:MAG TPA: hypothetical protein DCX07_10155 [Phycisphaerales bacterium]|nr:hypothetical protein [Phycisphaerales bacterium]
MVPMLLSATAGGAAPDSAQPARLSSYELPIAKRTFLVGTAGFAPANFPRMSADDVSQFWKDVQAAGELHGVHTDWKDLRLLDVTAKSVPTDLVVGLGFQKPAEWTRDVEALKRVIRDDVLGKYPQVKYLFIGNEVNALYDAHPREFDRFVDAYKDVYAFVKKEFPHVKVFTTFQYERLLGRSHVSGLAPREPQWFLLKKFDDRFDLLGLTTYPYLEYTDPARVPDAYLKQIARHTAKPLAITETAWMARETFGGRLKPLSDQGYTGSEDEQARYIQRLAQLSQTVPLEFINWLHINDFAPWKNGDVPANVGLAAFISTALKCHDGREKAAWKLWLDLKSFPKQ